MELLFDPDPDGAAAQDAPQVHIGAFGQGADEVVAALADAGPQVELFDEELWCVPNKLFRALLDDVAKGESDPNAWTAKAKTTGALPVLFVEPQCFPESLGADQTGLSVVQFAGALSRAQRANLPDGAKKVIAGIRSLNAEDAAKLDATKSDQCLIFARSAEEMRELPAELAKVAAGQKILLHIDAGVLDPSLMPCVSNPLPGGLDWQTLIAAIKAVLHGNRLEAVLVSGYFPKTGFHAADFLIAKLIYKILSYEFSARTQV